jgi:hypothetical protein
MYSFLKLYVYPLSFLLIIGLFYWSFGYDLDRTDSVKLLGLAAALFALSYQVLSSTTAHFTSKGNTLIFRMLLVAGIIYRLLLFAGTPELSQDFYRYIWDGHLLIHQINPYIHLPKDILSTLGHLVPNANYLFDKMGELSQKHYSNYPPISQYIYGLAAYVGGDSIPKSILVFKVIVLLADLCIVWLSSRILAFLGQPQWKVFYYFLNPLVIIELSGNLHLEGVMIAFFLGGIWALIKLQKHSKPRLEHMGSVADKSPYKTKHKQQHAVWLFLGGCLIALSIMTKLISILFLPFLLLPLGLKRTLVLGGWIGLCTGIFWGPLLEEGFWNSYLETIGLWFNNFEFNASLYNVVKSIAMENGHSAYRSILTYGKILPFLMMGVALAVFIWQWKKIAGLINTPHRAFSVRLKNLVDLHFKEYPRVMEISINSMLFMFTGHLLVATTVHPWYLCFGVILAVFTSLKYAYLWSGMVFLSYVTYSDPNFKENLGVIALEYLIVFGFLFYEIVKIKRLKRESVKNV